MFYKVPSVFGFVMHTYIASGRVFFLKKVEKWLRFDKNSSYTVNLRLVKMKIKN